MAASSWLKVAITGFDVGVATQIASYLKRFPFFFLEFHFFLQSGGKEVILDFSPRTWLSETGLFPL
jgi:hypothetical protein